MAGGPGRAERRAWPVVAAGAVLGLAFNVKLFQALIPIPAIALLVLAARPRRVGPAPAADWPRSWPWG